MLKTIMVFPDGTELSSGTTGSNAIQSYSLIESVNSGSELTIGSVCCNSIEVKVFAPSGEFSVQAGTEATVYREDETGNRYKVGVFILEQPTRSSANTLKIVGYDRVSKLDKDLTTWLAEYDGWDIEPGRFAEDICRACGLQFVPSTQVNSGYRITPFKKSPVTGRQLMKWLAELTCCFCRANADGNIEFGWYEESGERITPTGENYYFQNGLAYEDYVIEPITMAQITLSDSENGVPWPLSDEGVNSYIISGNPMMPASISDPALENILNNISARLKKVSYTPCKVTIPANMNIHAGGIIDITDKNGQDIRCYVMTKTQNGMKDTIECTGSRRRDSTQAMNNKTQQEIAQDAVSQQTGEEIFNKITNGGTVQGIYQQDGKWYINGEFAQVYNLVASSITAGRLNGANGNAYFDLDSGSFWVQEGKREMNLSGGYLMGFYNYKQVATLWPESETSGRLTLGKCAILGDDNRLWIYTRDAQTLEKVPLYASWKEIKYKDENGDTQTVKVLAGTPS
jgi:hypothetical protein